MSDLQSRIGALRWYHTIELPGGVETPGDYDLRPIVNRLPWPESLEGKRCLDVGSRDGFYAFEMERRGAAEVISLDLEEPSAMHFALKRPPDEQIAHELEVGRRAFEAAREALGSRVKRRHLSVYDLSVERDGEFDFALIGTLLLHLRDPVAALAGIHAVLRGDLIVNEVVLSGLVARRRRPLVEPVMLGPFWWVPNPATLRRIVEAAGFEVRAGGTPYRVPHGRGFRPPPLRDCLRRPVAEIPRRLSLRRGAPHAWLLASPKPS